MHSKYDSDLMFHDTDNFDSLTNGAGDKKHEEFKSKTVDIEADATLGQVNTGTISFSSHPTS